MKIGILTQPLRTNYGGVLQNYALQTVLKRMGHEPITIDPPCQPIVLPRATWMRRALKRTFHKLFGLRDILFIDPEKQANFNVSTRHHTPFFNAHLNILTRDYPLSSELTEQHHFDAYIVGSDQVWRPKYNNFLENMFLDFTHGQPVKRIAYAASFGVDRWEPTPEQTAIMKRCIRRFDAISVREKSGVELCNQYLDQPVEFVLDPTMLLTPADYKALIAPKQTLHTSGRPHVATYILDVNTAKKRIVKQACEVLGRGICQPIGRPDNTRFPTIGEWLHGISTADFVVTDSFHGAVFSILFNKNFVVIKNRNRGISRIDSLLRLFGLEERIITGNALPELLPIDYKSVNELLVHHREKAFAFLNKALGEVESASESA